MKDSSYPPDLLLSKFFLFPTLKNYHSSKILKEIGQLNFKE